MSAFARFLFQKGHFSAKNERVKPGAFNPGNREDLSIFYVPGLSEARKAVIARSVSTHRNQAVRARAEIDSTDLRDTPLSFVRDDQPIYRHGNLVGWPLGEADEHRMDRVQIATTLANRASLHV